MSNDRDVAIKGGFWTSISTAVTLVSTLARVMILTRFLEKSDFGVVSIINMVIGLCTTFTDLGFASVIMYKQKLSVREFSSLYWTQLVLFVFIYFVLFLGSPFISSFYEEPILNSLIPIASLSIIVQAIGKLYDSVLQKQYKFKSLAIRNIICNVLSLLLASWLAWKGFGVYSLILSTLFSASLFSIWNFASGYRLQPVIFQFNLKEIVPLIKIGVYQTGTQILDFISNKLDVLFIGKFLGTEALGVYDLSKELVIKLVQFIKTVVSKVALPIISNNNSDDESVKRKFLAITKVVAYVCLPICATVAVFSEDIVRIMYGIKFLDTAPLVSIFAIVTMFTSITSFFDMLGVAKGRTDLNFINTVYRVALTVPIVYITCHLSIFAVSLGQLLTTCILVVLYWNVVVKKTYPIDLKLYFSQFKALLLVLISVGFITYLLLRLNISIYENYLVRLFICASAYLVLLMVSFYLFLRKDLTYFLNLIRRK